MGKLKFTLSNIWLWLSLAGVTILTENLQYLSSGMKDGLNIAPVFIMMLIGFISLFMFYFLNHKENKIKLDFVLIPAFALVGIFLIVGIWVQSTGTYTALNGTTYEYAITNAEKVKDSFIVVLFLGFLYGMFFMFSRTQPHTKTAVIPLYVAIAFVYTAIIFSLIKENKSYKAIFSDNPDNELISIVSFFGNKYYYGGIILVGIIACMLVNYHRPRMIWYLSIAFFVVILISTAALAPIISALAIVPIYLLEEIVRYSVKRKWYIAIAATITILALLFLVIFFYIGTVFEWKGFKGIDLYVTKTIFNKNFTTLTGRTKIWAASFKDAINNPIHMIFGHGFLVSRQQTVALTASIFNGGGVRTTHNGYLQVLFDFGFVGLAIHAILVCYFIYSLIRLLLVKRFHFVIVYGLAGLSYAIYNIAESSPLFGIGIKELFMTAVLAIPVMTRNKLLGYPKVKQEAMELPVEAGQLDYIKLGKGLSIIIVSFMVALLPLFFVQFTYDQKVLMKTLGWIELYLFIALLFIPYLIAIYYKNTSKLHFILHCAFNGAALLLVAFVCTVPLIILKKGDLALHMAPIFVFVFLFANALSYSFIKGGTIFDWLRIFGVGTFVNGLTGYLSVILFGGVIYLVIQNNGAMNWFVYLFGIIANLAIFYMFLYLIPVFKTRHVIYEINRISLYHDKCCTIKDETTYG